MEEYVTGLQHVGIPTQNMAAGAIDHVVIDVTDVEKVFEEICGMGLNTLQDEIYSAAACSFVETAR